MFRFFALLAFSAFVAATPVAQNDGELINVITVNNIAEVKALYPDAEFTPLERRTNADGDFTYFIGKKTDDDRIIGEASDRQSWTPEYDFTFILEYCCGGATVNYVEVNVKQSSNEGRGYVVKGGVGQTTIDIVIEAKQTLFFDFAVYVYGH